MNYVSTITVWTTLRFPGFHKWSEAPDVVRHLRKRHRHNFHIRIELSVEHSEREVEFQLLKSELGTFMAETYPISEHLNSLEFGGASCEAIGADIIKWMQIKYPDRRWYEVEVSEDGESGAIVVIQA